MTLNELLDMQRELQKHSDKQPSELEEIYLAQADEMGEIIHALKWGMEPVSKHPGWAWWHRDNKPVATRTQVADELADLLCFVLLELIYLSDSGQGLGADYGKWDNVWDYLSDSGRGLVVDYGKWENVWEEANAWEESNPDKDLDFSYIANLWGYIYAFNGSGGMNALEFFVRLCAHLGFSQDEIEAAYKDAYDKNVARWREPKSLLSFND